tara:strand:- start:309 stop:1043 length:735 start_codon:yes stop_codon:yes gene_type:complete
MTGKKIKIALCLSGEPRSSMASFPYIYETFLTDNNRYETEVYIHSLKGFRALNMYEPKNSLIENLNITQLQISLNKSLLNESKKFNNSHNPTLTMHSNTLTNQFLMFRSIYNCFKLIEEPYDIYIRARYDMIFKSKFPFIHILEEILENKYDMFIPYQFPNKKITNEYNDQFAIGNYSSMSIYSNILKYIPKLIDQTDNFNSQIWIKNWLDKNNIKVHQAYIDWRLIRQCNIITNDELFNFLDE